MKYYLILITLLVTACAVQGQTVFPGIKGGLNGYSIMSDQSNHYVPKVSYHFGVLAHFHLSNKFGLQPEVIYSAQGARYENSSADLRLKYVNIPVLFQYMFGNGFRVEVGPQLGMLASAKIEFEGSKADVKSQFKGADAGVALGMSYVKPSLGLGFDIRYNQGLTNINANGPYNTVNSGLQVGVFYLFAHQPPADRN